MLTIDVAALTLFIRSEGPALAHTFVNADSEPRKCLVDIFLGSGYKTAAVGVLDSKNHVAAMLAGEDVIIKSRTHSTDMKRSGG